MGLAHGDDGAVIQHGSDRIPTGLIITAFRRDKEQTTVKTAFNAIIEEPHGLTVKEVMADGLVNLANLRHALKFAIAYQRRDFSHVRPLSLIVLDSGWC